jgi:hypothetical protein
MATPMVSGAAGLLCAAHPNATVASVKDAILRSVDHLSAFASITFSGGRLNAAQALQVIDTTPPSGVALTGTGIANPYQLASSFGLGWTATDAGTGVKSFDIRYERAPYNGAFGPWTTWKSGVSTPGATFGSAPGYSYCFEVRARDKVLNVSGWSAPHYTTTKNATLTLTNAQYRRMDLVVSLCNGCGSVALYSGLTYLGTFSTNAASFGTRRLVFVRSSSHVNGPATITIKVVTSGKPVMIEGLGLLRY